MIQFVGDEGTININGQGLTVHHSIIPKAPGIAGLLHSKNVLLLPY